MNTVYIVFTEHLCTVCHSLCNVACIPLCVSLYGSCVSDCVCSTTQTNGLFGFFRQRHILTYQTLASSWWMSVVWLSFAWTVLFVSLAVDASWMSFVLWFGLCLVSVLIRFGCELNVGVCLAFGVYFGLLHTVIALILCECIFVILHDWNFVAITACMPVFFK